MPASIPQNPLAVFQASDKEPWDVRKVGHLYRRAGFGVSYKKLQEAIKQSPTELVDGLLNFDPANDPFNDTLESIIGFVDLKEPRQVQSWWLHRMLNTQRPLQEKLALFYHNLFATSASKIGSGEQMHVQIELFRQKCLGSFKDMVIAVGRDPAMLIWLDGRESRKSKPNENYAREVMELFTLGVGNYTETDIKQLARCFTGWNIKDNIKSYFDAKAFDDGEKTILNETGKFNDEQAVAVLLKQPAAPKHLAKRLLFEFVHPEPPQALIDALAKRIVALDWQMKPILREILLSRVFYSEWAYRSRIKSPTELSVSLALMMGGKISTSFLREQLSRMGQSLLYPPNVKGWDGHETWINSNTILVRYNLGMACSQQRGNDYAKPAPFMETLKAAEIDSYDKAIDYFAMQLLDNNISKEAREKLIAYVSTDEKGKPRKFNIEDAGLRRGLRSIVHMMTTVPEFQLA